MAQRNEALTACNILNRMSDGESIPPCDGVCDPDRRGYAAGVSFLTARWESLLMQNWAIDPALLEGRVPTGTELDTHEGKTWVSLVGFLFLDTRLKGIPVPGHRNFEELNLRFYVRRGDKRGVVFIKELVPKWAIATLARLAYNENYVSLPMDHRLDDRVSYFFGDHGELSARPVGENRTLEPGSHEEFIAEHYWGYANQRDGGTVEYEVQHPPWRVRDAVEPVFRGPEDLYGAAFAAVLATPPDSCFVAEGSEVSVEPGGRL